MPGYDPFSRGPHPVGVRTFEVVDAAREGRVVPVEVWYPAETRRRGADLDAATQDAYAIVPGSPTVTQAAVRDAEPAEAARSGAAPAVVFSHGFAGHRRQSTHLTTHLASHGYVVAAPDHIGNTTPEVLGWALGIGAPADMAVYTADIAERRVGDARRTLDALLAGEFGVAVDASACGMSGHSFGGWTTLATTAEDPRIVSIVLLAPAGGDGGVPTGPADPRTVMHDRLDLDWGRAVPALTLVADGDTVLPYPMMTDLLTTAPAIDRLVVLVDADHFHFCDNVETVHDLMTAAMGEGAKPSSELVPGDHAHAVTTGLGLAHFDATLRVDGAAAAFLEGDLAAAFRERGIAIEIVPA